jgi:hypothetical protein
MLQLPVGGRTKTPSRQLLGLQTCEGGAAGKEDTEDTQDYNRKGVLFQPNHSRFIFAAALQGSSEQQQLYQTCQVEVAGPATVELRVPGSSLQQDQQPTGQSVQAPKVNSAPLDSVLRVVTVVQQIMTEFNGAVSEENKIVAITKTVLNLMQQNGHYSS